MRLEISKLNKTREILQNKLRAAEEQKIDAAHERNTLKNQISGLEKGMCLTDGWICLVICSLFIRGMLSC